MIEMNLRIATLELNLHTQTEHIFNHILQKVTTEPFSEGRRCLQILISPLHWFLNFSLPSGKVGTG